MISENTKKVLIVSLIALALLGLVALATLTNIDFKLFRFASISSLIEQREDLVKTQQQLQAQEKAYSTAITKNGTEQTAFTSEKNKYNAISDETIKIVKEATTQDNYSIEYMWIKLGNYASSNNLTIAMADPTTTSVNVTDSTSATSSTSTSSSSSSSSSSQSSNNTKSADTSSDNSANSEASTDTLFTIQVSGSYLDVSDFVFEVENDKELRFKLDNISMDYISGTAIRAKFNVKNLTINK